MIREKSLRLPQKDVPRHTSAGHCVASLRGKVAVNVKVLTSDAESLMVLFDLQDTGIGIPIKRLDTLSVPSPRSTVRPRVFSAVRAWVFRSSSSWLS
jgi:hypothetical protein